MRLPRYLSYSAFALWEKDPDEYYRIHLAESRAPRQPQERPAAVGSAFDAYAKSSLHSALFGAGSDPRYSLEALFEAQVEEHNHNWAGDEGQYVFHCYQDCGAYFELLDLLIKSKEPPRFEFTVEATVAGVPFLGKPDCRFVTAGDVHVVHDWKCNGYCSKSTTSPTKGYMLCRDAHSGKPSKSHMTAHKNFIAKDFNGLAIHDGGLEDSSQTWADQLCLYAWALGEPIGDENVVLSIDQIVAKPMPEGRPQLRVAQYRARVREPYQLLLRDRFTRAWQAISTGHVFQDLSRDENDARCEILDREALSLQTEDDDYFAAAVRPRYRG